MKEIREQPSQARPTFPVLRDLLWSCDRAGDRRQVCGMVIASVAISGCPRFWGELSVPSHRFAPKLAKNSDTNLERNPPGRELRKLRVRQRESTRRKSPGPRKVRLAHWRCLRRWALRLSRWRRTTMAAVRFHYSMIPLLAIPLCRIFTWQSRQDTRRKLPI